MTYNAELKDYERLLATLSHKALRRATANGLTVDFDDLFQEAKATFVVALEKFDAELGIKFSTYLWTAVKNNLMRQEQKTRTSQWNTVSLDREISEDGDKSNTLHDLVAADQESVDDRMERHERLSETFGGLSRNAQRVISILNQPPLELIKEMRRMDSFQSHCKTHGFTAATRQLNVHVICVALGLSKTETRKVKREFKTIMENTYGDS